MAEQMAAWMNISERAEEVGADGAAGGGEDGVSQDGDDRTVTGADQRGQGAGPSLAGHTRSPHAWPSAVTAPGGVLWSWGAGTGTPAEQPVRDWGQVPPAGSSPSGAPPHRGAQGETWAGVPHVPRVLQGALVGWGPWSPPLCGSGDKGTWVHPHPSQAFHRVGILGGCSWDPPGPTPGAGSTKGTGEPPKNPRLPQRRGERSGGEGEGLMCGECV